MNNSQLKATIGLVATTIASICAAVLPQIQSLPPEYRFYGSIVSILGAVAGAVVIALNQSLHTGHVSVPIDEARRLGLAADEKRDEVKG